MKGSLAILVQIHGELAKEIIEGQNKKIIEWLNTMTQVENGKSKCGKKIEG